MVWQSTIDTDTSTPISYYSVLASPCGKQLVEIASKDNGGRGSEQFHAMTMARAVFKDWNQPVNFSAQPLLPLRISRAVGQSRFNDTLSFYGAGTCMCSALASFIFKLEGSAEHRLSTACILSVWRCTST
jgi:hypothetical protein